jgi:hypothetical protein
MKTIPILLMLLFCVPLLKAQEAEIEATESSKTKVRISGAYLMWGNRSSSYIPPGYNENIESLSGGVVQFNPNHSNAYAFISLRILMGGITLDIVPKNKSNHLHQLRAGFSFNGQNHIGQVYNYKTQLLSRTYIDTITSSATGNTFAVYRDSMYSESSSATHTNRYATLDFSYVFRLNPEKTLSLYGGLGLGLGLIYNATTTVSETRQNYVTQNYYFTQPPSGQMHYGTNQESYERVIRNKPGFGMDIFIPLGINLRLGKDADVWKHISLFTEIRPTLSLQHTSQTGSNSFTGTTRLFGVRAHF